MLIGGIQKFSLIDYPGEICAIIFTQGCNFRCPYCHNPELVDRKLFSRLIPEKEIFSFLEKRKGKLDAVEITGGEPTLQKDLIEFIKKIKEMGFLVKLDSNGSNPGVLMKIISLGLIDYIAMDVKAPLERYQEITNSSIEPEKIKQSIDIIKKSNIDYEFRTTITRMLKKEDLFKIAKLIKGAKKYALQQFVPSKTLDPKFKEMKPYSKEELESFKKSLQPFFENIELRI